MTDGTRRQSRRSRPAPVDADAHTIASTKRTINKTMLILARGHARRAGAERNGNRWSIPVVVLLVAASTWGDPSALSAILP